MANRCAVFLGFGGCIGGAARGDGHGGEGEFEFGQADHGGGLVVIKQGVMIRGTSFAMAPPCAYIGLTTNSREFFTTTFFLGVIHAKPDRMV
jgi:hypothetical protein